MAACARAADGLSGPYSPTSWAAHLDGRNRWLACQRAGVECPANVYMGEDGAVRVAFVVSLNEKRRHLDASQRAMVAAKIANLPLGANQHGEGISIEVAAELMNVGRASVERAGTVQEHGTRELVATVEQGKVAVSTAAEIARVERERKLRTAGYVRV